MEPGAVGANGFACPPNIKDSTPALWQPHDDPPVPVTVIRRKNAGYLIRLPGGEEREAAHCDVYLPPLPTVCTPDGLPRSGRMRSTPPSDTVKRAQYAVRFTLPG
jgi:hypothetical protein